MSKVGILKSQTHSDPDNISLIFSFLLPELNDVGEKSLISSIVPWLGFYSKTILVLDHSMPSISFTFHFFPLIFLNTTSFTFLVHQLYQ